MFSAGSGLGAMNKAYEIAIASAGPAGLAAALYLERAGHKVTIFERFDEPKPVGSGLMLQPTGLTVLADLGLLDEIHFMQGHAAGTCGCSRRCQCR